MNTKTKIKIKYINAKYKLFAFIAKLLLKWAGFHNNLLKKICKRNEYFIRKMSDTNKELGKVVSELRSQTQT